MAFQLLKHSKCSSEFDGNVISECYLGHLNRHNNVHHIHRDEQGLLVQTLYRRP